MSIDSHALVSLSPNYWQGRNGHAPKWIIVHGTAGGSSAQGIAAMFATKERAACTHYVIGQDGTIICCCDETNAAWGNGVVSAGCDVWWVGIDNPNYWTISIEHVKPSTDNSDPLTAAQQAASFALISRICARWGIPRRKADSNGGITGHFSIDPVNRARCPGLYDFDALWKYLAEDQLLLSLEDPRVGHWFAPTTGGGWHCFQTNRVVGGAILDAYRKVSLAPADLRGLTLWGLPTSDEVPLPGVPGGTQQSFERALVNYDPQRVVDQPPGLVGPVYVAHLR